MSIKTLAISAGMLALCLLPVLAQEEPKTLPEDKHKQLYENVCGSCHGADLVIGEPRDHLPLSVRAEAKLIRVTTAGMRESHVHDVAITKEAPNYRSE